VIGTGDGKTTTFTYTLSGSPISPLSVTMKINGRPVSGDCPWWNSACNTAIASTGTFGSPGKTWSTGTDISLGWYLTDSNGFLQRATSVSGTTGGTAPIWNLTLGGATTDGTVTWVNVGPALVAGVQPWLTGLADQTCSGCSSLPAASYWVKIVYHMNRGFLSSASREVGTTVFAGHQIVVSSPPSVANATGYDVYVSCRNQIDPGVSWCLPSTKPGNGLETLQASNVAFGSAWVEPTNGLIAGAPVPPAPGSINYSNGQVQITFGVPPSAGASITVDYTVNGWMFGSGVMDEDGRNSAWLGTNPICLAPAAACDGVGEPLPNANSNVAADLDGWIGQFAANYFSTVRTSMKAQFPNMMYLGPDTLGTWGVPARKEILQAAATYLDGSTLAWLGSSGLNSNAIYQYVTQYLGDIPLINSSYLPATADSFLWRYPNNSVADFGAQELRGQAYRNIMNDMLGTLSYNQSYQWVGMDIFGLLDHWMEKINWGPVSLNDNPYDGKSACTEKRVDPWGFTTGGEEVLPSWQPATVFAPAPSSAPRIQVNVSGSLYIFEATTSGISGIVAPAWPVAVNSTITDGTVTWKNVGPKSSASCFGDAIDFMKQGNALWYSTTQ